MVARRWRSEPLGCSPLSSAKPVVDGRLRGDDLAYWFEPADPLLTFRIAVVLALLVIVVRAPGSTAPTPSREGWSVCGCCGHLLDARRFIALTLGDPPPYLRSWRCRCCLDPWIFV